MTMPVAKPTAIAIGPRSSNTATTRMTSETMRESTFASDMRYCRCCTIAFARVTPAQGLSR